ncbi:uncharacterized protein BT62DRAFT_451803 [Guyanagaster necrorhizus]|uniref:Uncharacterized protein n=1 Tax=Guyanagaster necrorhizus TaxID=856835 RepID=A0A9P7VKD0_9AGAR|nr:uncharacterized protein BT62DRAFT_451803 [Guyanagaster necrorhizus MCA 3950]KAG7442232.1 hypothetical protein BT62DRAFT_451803 [Guyanagaster necrorhizus MCA 3950]
MLVTSSSYIVRVTEFAELQFGSPDFSSQSSLRDLLLRLRTNQATWSGFPVCFYTESSGKTLYLNSGWQSVPAHEEWIAGDENQTLLKLFEPHVQITDFVHLDVEFGDVLSAGEERLKFRKVEGGKQWEIVRKDVEGKKADGERYCFSKVGSDELSEGEIIQKVSL